MDCVQFRRVLIWAIPTVAFAMCWAWTISSFGRLGLYVGWIPAAIMVPVTAGLVSLLWSVIALTVLLGWHCRASERSDALDPEASA